MSGSFIAKYRTPVPCKVCGKHVEKGERIVWSRRNRGVFYHEHCYNETRSSFDPAPVTTHKVTTPDGKSISIDVPLVRHGATVTDASASSFDSPKTFVPATKQEFTTPTRRTGRKLNSNDSWDLVLGAVLPVTNRILLVGPPSSGKSTTAMILAGTKHRITMTETTSREDLIGMFHLIAGETKWIDGPVTTAMRNGEAILFDEVDRYSPECASLFYSLIDDKPHVSLPSGELLEAKDGYKVIMTTNETLDTLPPAVQDRIEVIINANEPHEAVIADLPKYAQEVVLRFYRTQPVRELRLGPTVRRMKAFARLTSIGIPNQIAANLVFGNKGGSEVLSTLTSAQSNY